ncbi:HNH endonuclease [Streptomyces nanhaiensis]|uniref:HNH endonuclease n=1 Tax=Streptomyces nanhaiensis TaxID=679319 RepID=UPI00399CED2D
MYYANRAVPFSAPPTVEQLAAERRGAIDWAQEALDDPHTVILAINAVGSLAPTTDPIARATPYEIALTSAKGLEKWHQFINPQWDNRFMQQIDPHGAIPADIEEAPTFRDVHEALTRRLSGKRVITYGRNMVYATLYSALEYAWLGGALPEGAVWPDTLQTLRGLEQIHWECARLRHAELENEWDITEGHYALPSPLPAGNAVQQCREVAKILQHMATPALRYAELNARAERAVREGRSHIPRDFSETRRSRIPASRQAVLERSKGACENPDCPDLRYTSARSRNGTYLLEVDHIDDHAEGGEDLPRSMIALCPNCHAIKTRTAVAKDFRASLRAAALANHHRMLGGST